MVSLFRKKTKAEKVRGFAEDILIRKAVAKERAKQRILDFEARRSRAVARARNPLSKRFRGIAVKAGRRAGKELGKSLTGFAQKIGKPSEAEKETVVIIGGKPRRVKGRVRIVRAQQEAFDGGLGVGGDLGLSVDLLGKGPKKKRKGRELEPFRFF